MNYKEKKRAHDRLLGVTHIEADIAMLKKHLPGSRKLAQRPLNQKQYASELLWLLLDHVTEQQIVANRREVIAARQTAQGGNPDPEADRIAAEEKAAAEKAAAEKASRPHRRRGESSERKKKLTKEEEYPDIKWGTLPNPDIIAALVIYEDRIRTWRRMKVLDSILDDSPSAEDISEMAELRIRNLQCFDELQSLNDTGKFKNLHPYLLHREEYGKLKALWQKDRSEFIREFQNCQTNIRRYRGRLGKDGLSEDEHEKNMAYLMRHTEREKIFKEILNDEPASDHI